jgi:hypothetical protein
MPKLNKDVTAWSVAGQKILDGIKDNMPPPMIKQIKEKALRQALSDNYGAGWELNLDSNGRPQSDGIGSTLWLMNVDEERAERHYAAISRFVGPAAAQAERERIARLKGHKDNKGK